MNRTWMTATAILMQVIPVVCASAACSGPTILPTDTVNLSMPVGKIPTVPAEMVKEATPGLVPYAAEVTVTGTANFDREQIESIRRKGAIVQHGCQGNRLNLFRGRVLFNCKNAVHLTVPDATIEISPGAVVYVYSTGESTVLLNLHDNHRHSVVASVAGKTIDVHCGRELLVTRYTKLSFDEARLVPGVWYRTVYQSAPAPHLKVYVTQFSLLSAALIFPAVRKLVGDPRRSKIIKTAAALFAISRDPTPFRPSSDSPQATAHKQESDHAANSN